MKMFKIIIFQKQYDLDLTSHFNQFDLHLKKFISYIYIYIYIKGGQTFFGRDLLKIISPLRIKT